MQAHDPVNLRLMKRIPGNDREVSGFDLELEAKVVGSPLLERLFRAIKVVNRFNLQDFFSLSTHLVISPTLCDTTSFSFRFHRGKVNTARVLVAGAASQNTTPLVPPESFRIRQLPHQGEKSRHDDRLDRLDLRSRIQRCMCRDTLEVEGLRRQAFERYLPGDLRSAALDHARKIHEP